MIGKKIGGFIYAHRDYIDGAVKQYKPEWITRLHMIKKIMDKFPYTIVKVGPDSITFTICEDFDTASEPTVGPSMRYKNGRLTYQEQPTDPWVYHGKEEMVGYDYIGFNRIKAIIWHKKWKQYLKDHNISHANIGKKSVWNKIKEKVK